MKTILLTGCAGFIGSHLAELLLENKYSVVGIDNFDDFYAKEIKLNNLNKAQKQPNFSFFEIDFTDFDSLKKLPPFDMVVHLGAKAGVRPSIDNPTAYIKTNITGAHNILELMKIRNVKKLIFASSSSVYGNNKKIPFSETDNVDHPISTYAFTKKSCELMNHAYHHLYHFDIINFRFFTVYGERQRPDLAIHKFVKMAINYQPITIYGDGSTYRDYTYVLDIVDGILKGINLLKDNQGIFETINLGNNTPIKLSDMVDTIYKTLAIEPNINYLPMQMGDVERTYADISKATRLLGYNPNTTFEVGIKNFVDWYLEENKVYN